MVLRSRTVTMPEAPNYVHLYESGELEHRVSQALASLESCRVCRSGRLARVAHDSFAPRN